MSDVVNLNRARKKKRAEAAEAKASENRAKFGRTKAEKRRAADTEKRAACLLDGHEFSDKDEPGS